MSAANTMSIKSPNIKLGNSMVQNTATNITKNASAAVNNVTKNASAAVANVTKNASAAVTNVTKNASAVVTNAANAVTNAATNVVNSVTNAGTSAVNTMANSFKSVQGNSSNTINTMANSIQESVDAVPATAPALSISLPLIIGLGVLMIGLALVVYYKTTIQNGLTAAYDAVKKMVEPSPPPAEPTEDDMSTVNKIVPSRKTVFNVNSNKYIYSDAEPLCKALGAELATYDQVKQAWDQGADWCNYGWIKGQAAVYPTQKSTYDALQQSSVDDERMACGNVGVNGGYMDNPELRYGVNCYGDKPSQTAHDLKVTNELIQPPLTPSALKQKMVEQEFKANANLIGLLPFNGSSW